MDDKLGERLAAARKAVNLSQERACEALGIEKITISSYERGVRQPGLDVLVSMAKLYRISADHLLGLDDKKAIDGSGLTEEEYRLLTELVAEIADNNQAS